MDYGVWFSNRLAQLRQEKGVSARDMSLSLGQSECYINKIENQRTLPSMAGFFYICDYLKISPSEFFDTDSEAPFLTNETLNLLKRLPESKITHVMQIVKDLSEL